MSVFEMDTGSGDVEVRYVRGSDLGGGIGGLLYSLRGDPQDLESSFNHYNARGDVIAKTDVDAAITWEGVYEAFGTQVWEAGVNEDRQRANTKEEDPTGLLNEGFRYRDLDAAVFLTRDPAGFVDGPNLYTYVRQNPWTFWDPLGLVKNEREFDDAKEEFHQKHDQLNDLRKQRQDLVDKDVRGRSEVERRNSSIHRLDGKIEKTARDLAELGKDMQDYKTFDKDGDGKLSLAGKGVRRIFLQFLPGEMVGP